MRKKNRKADIKDLPDQVKEWEKPSAASHLPRLPLPDTLSKLRPSKK